MNTEDYVSYELAVKLKEKGFNCECNHYYKDYDNGDIFCSTVDNTYCPVSCFDDTEYPAPTLNQAQKWLREEKNVFVTVEPCTLNRKLTGEWYYDITYVWCKGFTRTLSQSGFNSYEKALSAGITKALELI